MADDHVVPIPTSSSSEINPHSLFDAVSYIEQQYANECGGAEMPPGQFTTKQRLEFVEVGFKAAFASGFITALLMPIAIGVFERYVPIFGDAEPSTYDRGFALLMTVAFSFFYSVFIAQAAVKWRRGYTKAMVSSLLQGVIFGSILKAIVVFLLFHFIYLNLLNDQILQQTAMKLYAWKIKPQAIITIYNWLGGFRQVFLTSAWFVMATSAMFIAIPAGAYLYAGRRNRRLIMMGVFKDDEAQ